MGDSPALLRLSLARGSRQYASVFSAAEFDPGPAALSHEELVVLLLLGFQPFAPFVFADSQVIVTPDW